MEITGMKQHTKCLIWVLGWPINCLDNQRSTSKFKCTCDGFTTTHYLITFLILNVADGCLIFLKQTGK